MTIYKAFQNNDAPKAEIPRIFANGFNNDWKYLKFLNNFHIDNNQAFYKFEDS